MYVCKKNQLKPFHTLSKSSFESLYDQNYIYGILTRCEVKMAGYWPSSLFLRARVYGPKRSPGRQIEHSREISIHLDRASLVNKGFITWLSGNFSCGARRLVPSGQDSSILPAWVANHSTGFDSSCPSDNRARI